MSWSTDLEVFSNAVPLKITVVWTDPPAPGGSLSPLVNDLDLFVVAPGGTVYRGNQFTGSWSTPNPGAVVDTANNVENVFVQSPAAGQWTLQVSSTLTATNPPGLAGQDFALVYSGDAADCAPPPAPTGLVATATAANRIDLSWNLEPAAVSYKVNRSTSSGGPYTEIANIGATSYVDLAVSGGTTYYYTVRSVDAGVCDSGPSNEDSALATGDCILPPDFAGLSTVVSQSGTCSIDLSWNPATSNCPAAEVVYDIYRSPTPGFTPSAANLIDACVTNTFHEDTNVSSSTTYYYIVRAEDGTGSGGGLCNGGNVDANLVEMSGATGLTPTTLYSNDFEGIDDFTHAPDVGGKGDSWRGIQTACTAASGTGTYRFGGASCNANYSSDNFASAGPATLSVPTGSFNVTLSLNHRWQFEPVGASVFDGGYVAVSVDGSPFQPVASSRLSGTGYNGTVDGACSNGVGTDVFTGTSSGYSGGTFQSTSIDLDGVCDDILAGVTGCGGHDVQFRFTGVTDCSIARDGWLLDDVVITADVAGACTAAPEPVVFFTVTSTDQRNDLEWLNPASGGTVTITYRTDRFPADVTDGTQLSPPLGPPGAPQTFTHQPPPADEQRRNTSNSGPRGLTRTSFCAE